MAENSKIEWTDHIDLNATGRVLGAYKVAAARTGCSLEAWTKNRQAGRLWCFRCRQWKAGGTFSVDKSRRGGRASTCKPCTSEASTAARYGLTLDGLRIFRKRHGNVCGICGDGRVTVIDHHHKTGKLRGLLCHNCNSAIGKLKESPELFKNALAYLEKHNG